MQENDFINITKIVIDKLEGGYYHPDFHLQNPSKFPRGTSGETMFGLDRHNGHDLYYSTKRKSSNVYKNLDYIYSGVYQYKTPESKEFWSTLDKANARSNWQWLYRGGKNEKRLTELAAKIIYPQFMALTKKYLTPEAQKAVFKDPRLIFHFSYATWNGSGWFADVFAPAINDAVSKGVRGNELAKIAINSRLNSGNKLIAKGGKQMQAIFDSGILNDLKPGFTFDPKKTLMFVSLTAAGIYYLYQNGYLDEPIKKIKRFIYAS
jgi:hypothetical protein